VQLNIIDLFSGIGGFSLGLHNADKRFKTIAFAENDPFCQKVLKKNFGNTKIFNDIREVSIDQPVFLVCGGFPCQGFSVARRLGIQHCPL
jgi:DNA (cytosine-5)-methyltransferase 1